MGGLDLVGECGLACSGGEEGCEALRFRERVVDLGASGRTLEAAQDGKELRSAFALQIRAPPPEGGLAQQGELLADVPLGVPELS